MTYENYINNILESRGRFNCGDSYKERHHIKPRCLGGSNDRDNLIDLFAEEHYTAHKLLAIENPDVEGLVRAWEMMTYPKGKTQRNYIIDEYDYKVLRELWSKHMSKHNPGLDKDGHPWNYGIPMSIEQRNKISKKKKGIKKGPDSEETKLKKSIATKKRFLEHPETFQYGTKNKICVNNGQQIKFIDKESEIPQGWIKGNCKTSGKHDMTNYYNNPEKRKKHSEALSGKHNPMYGNGYKVSNGNNGKATKNYYFKNKKFDCRKTLLKYLKVNGFPSISDSALRNIENNTYTIKTEHKYKEVIDNLRWEFKDENKIN